MKALKPIADAAVMLVCAFAGLFLLAGDIIHAFALALTLGKKVKLPPLVD